MIKVSEAVAPKSTTAIELLNKKKSTESLYLPTTLELLDRYLLGGIPSGILTEVCGKFFTLSVVTNSKCFFEGPSGVGKTQFCHMLTIVATLPLEEGGLNGSVVYFDTEKTFSNERLAFIKKESKFLTRPNLDWLKWQNQDFHNTLVVTKNW